MEDSLDKGRIIFKWMNKKEIYAKYNGKSRPQNLQAHIDKLHTDYIATRSGVDLGNDIHGLFGNILETDEVELLELDTIKKYIQNISKKNIDVFKTTISLRNEDALKYGFYNKKSWKDLLEIRIPEIARAFKIPLEDLEWIAAFHGKKERPHCHLIVWNKNQDLSVRRKPFIYFKNVKTAVAKEVFKEDLKAIYDEKDITKKEVGKISQEELKKVEEELKEIMPSIFNTPIISSAVKEEKIEKIIDKFVELEKVSNGYKKGFIYMYQTPESKQIINDISKLILDSNIDCKKEYNKYLDNSLKIDKILQKIDTHKDYEKSKNKAEYEMMKKIGNQILKMVKEIKTKEYKRKCEEWKVKREYWRQRHIDFEAKQGEYEARQLVYDKQLQVINIRNLIRETYKLLSEESMSNYQRLNRITRTFGDLSKREIKEIMKNNKRAGFDWYNEL